jgi:cryptochrome
MDMTDRDNPFSFIDWELQNQYDSNGEEIKPRPKGSEEAEERFAAWKEGRTGFP